MKKYDFEKARQIIASTPQLASASLGIYEDWFWTAETIWEAGEFKKDIGVKVTVIAGIPGSSWGTPTLLLQLEDGTTRAIECFTGKSDGKDPSLGMGLGPMSSRSQADLPPLEAQQ